MTEDKKKTNNLDVFIKSFNPITLKELNEKAAMLERSENKYVLTIHDLNSLINNLQAEFDILTIDNKKVFTYETIYFDSAKDICYRQHMQGKRQRFKARTRRYVDANLYFFEVKLKDIRGKTNKKRYACNDSEHGLITKKSTRLLQDSFKIMYKKDFEYSLQPSTKMSYKRITLVAKQGAERMTIDYALSFYDMNSNKTATSPDDFIIVETKSTTGNGIADKIFKTKRHRSTSCSKFCLSKILLKQISTYNNFLPLLKKSFPDFIKSRQL